MKGLEKDLFEQIKRGDDRAFSVLFRETYSHLCTYARDFLQKSEIAEEVVQDVFIKFWNSRKSITIHSSLKAYLFKMVQNNSLNYLRNHSTQKTIKEESLDNIDSKNPALKMEIDNTVFDKILSDEIEKDLAEALKNLPDQCREIFILCRFDGLSYAQTAQTLNLSVSTVKTQMGRAMEKLHIVMKKHL